MSPTDDRAARRKRAQTEARKAGSERAAKLQAALDNKEPPPGQTAPVAVSGVSGPVSVAEPSDKLVEPDTPERQARAAAAKIEATEAARRARPGTTSKAASKPPARAPRESTAKLAAPINKAARREPAKRATASKPEKMTHEEIETTIQHMELEFVQCRDFGHSWRPYSARWLPSFNQYEAQQICNRCKAIRTRFLSRTGSLLDTKYDYTEGYIVKGMGRLTGTDRDVIRLKSILAVLVEDTAE